MPAGGEKRAVGKSGCDALVVVMESADLGDRRDPPSIDGMSLPSFRRVHLEGLVRPVLRESSYRH
jgi:hypothetical protein